MVFGLGIGVDDDICASYLAAVVALDVQAQAAFPPPNSNSSSRSILRSSQASVK